MNQDNNKYRNQESFNGFNGQSLISPIELESNLVNPKIRLGILASGNGSNLIIKINPDHFFICGNNNNR